MKNLIVIGLLFSILISCSSSKKATVAYKNDVETKNSDTIRIANDSLEYEVIIIEPGFNTWLASRAKPRGFYTEDYLEGKNRVYISEWNNRVMQPQRYNPSLYEMRINYDYGTHYGYEVNYLIYNYFIFFQLNYKQQLAGFVPGP